MELQNEINAMFDVEVVEMLYWCGHLFATLPLKMLKIHNVIAV